jgi:hypothetical protein
VIEDHVMNNLAVNALRDVTLFPFGLDKPIGGRRPARATRQWPAAAAASSMIIRELSLRGPCRVIVRDDDFQ